MNLGETRLSDIISFNQLEKLLKNYSLTSGLDVALYDPDGEEQLCVRSPGCICKFGKGNFSCRESIVYSGKKSEELHSAYIYETPCGLIMCITALVFEGETLGYITTGPVVLWEKDEFFMEEFRKNCMKVGFDYREKSFDPSSIRQIDCRSMTSVSETLTMLLNYMLQEEKKYIRQRLEISRLNIERLRAAKEMQIRQAQPRYNKYPIELEKELISYVQMGDKNQATLIINKFLNEIFSFASGNLEIVKAKLYEFTAFLSRSAVEAGAPVSALTVVIKKSSHLLLENADFSDICRETVEVLDGFLEAVYQSRGKKNASGHLYKAIQYINEHYFEDIDLTKLAQHVFVSTYYLSHLFRREMGVTFSDYLIKVRVGRAKELLMEGRSVEEVCERVGYNDSNYFIKIFKKYVGVTPSKYRKSVL